MPALQNPWHFDKLTCFKPTFFTKCVSEKREYPRIFIWCSIISYNLWPFKHYFYMCLWWFTTNSLPQPRRKNIEQGGCLQAADSTSAGRGGPPGQRQRPLVKRSIRHPLTLILGHWFVHWLFTDLFIDIDIDIDIHRLSSMVIDCHWS